MATVYSLVCWGGSTGKSVTVNASTDLVTLTNHGLRNGKGVQFASGTLPTVLGTALALNTNYFAKWISTYTFELYYEPSLTTKIDFTSTGSSLVLKGSYYQGLSDSSRWGTRIYDGRVSWNTARTAVATIFDTEVVELGDDYDDLVSASWSCTIPAAAVVMTSKVNGVRGNGWHGGVVGAGYAAVVPNGGYTALSSGAIQDFEFDGFSAVALSTSGSGTCISTSGRGGNTVKNMILSGVGADFGLGMSLQGAMTKFLRNLVTKLHTGLQVGQYTYGALVANNTIVANAVKGVAYVSAGSTYGKFFNNAVLGNVANWQTGVLSALEAASGNSGESGDTVWTVGAGTSVTITSADFTNYAGGDFRPASASSLLFDAGTDYFGRLPTDLGDNEVPNYNNGGAEGIDIGCYEFDNGFGTHPNLKTTTISATGVSMVGAEVRIYDLDNTPAGSFGTELAGVESCSTSTFDFSGQVANTVKIQIMRDGYEEFGQTFVIPSVDSTFEATLTPEYNI